MRKVRFVIMRTLHGNGILVGPATTLQWRHKHVLKKPRHEHDKLLPHNQVYRNCTPH